MPALTLNLNDEASAGIEDFKQHLISTADAADIVFDSTERLTAAQRQQVTIINQQNSSLVGLANNGLTQVGTAANTAVKGMYDLAIATEQAQFHLAEIVVKEGASVIRWGVAGTSAVMGLQAAFGSSGRAARDHAKSIDEASQSHRILGEAAKLATSALAGAAAMYIVHETGYVRGADRMSNASAIAVKAAEKLVEKLTGIGPYVAGAGVAISAYGFLLANTGKGVDGFANNLDRVAATTNKMKAQVLGDIAELRTIGGQWFNDWLNTPMSIPALSRAWDAFNKDFTAGTSIFIENLNLTRDAYDKYLAIRSREHTESNDKLVAQREKEADGYARIRAANEQLATAEANRAESRKIASLKTIGAIQAEMVKTQEQAGALATAGKFDEDAQKAFAARREALLRQQWAVESDIQKKRAEQERAFWKDRNDWIERGKKAQEEYADKVSKVADIEAERSRAQKAMAGAFNRDVSRSGVENQIDVASLQVGAAKASLAANGKANGMSDAQIKEQERQLDAAHLKDSHSIRMQQLKEEEREAVQAERSRREEIEKIKDIEKKASESKKLEMDADRRRYDYEKKRIEENNKLRLDLMRLEIDQARAMEDEKLRLAKERADKEKAQADAEKGRIQGAFDAKGFMQSQDPQKVLRALQDRRAKEEQEAQSQKDKESGLLDREGGKAQFDRNQRAAATRGRRSAYNDAESGNVGEDEMAQAQAQAAQQTLVTQAKQGNISQQQAKIVSDMIKSQADQQVQLDAVAKLLQQLGQGQRGLTAQTQAGARNMASQVGSLGN